MRTLFILLFALSCFAQQHYFIYPNASTGCVEMGADFDYDFSLKNIDYYEPNPDFGKVWWDFDQIENGPEDRIKMYFKGKVPSEYEGTVDTFIIRRNGESYTICEGPALFCQLIWYSENEADTILKWYRTMKIPDGTRARLVFQDWRPYDLIYSDWIILRDQCPSTKAIVPIVSDMKISKNHSRYYNLIGQVVPDVSNKNNLRNVLKVSKNY